MRRRKRQELANRRWRTTEFILAERRYWRHVDSTRICQTLWNLPARQPRKETDQ